MKPITFVLSDLKPDCSVEERNESSGGKQMHSLATELRLLSKKRERLTDSPFCGLLGRGKKTGKGCSGEARCQRHKTSRER
jgi:hypothetical protein